MQMWLTGNGNNVLICGMTHKNVLICAMTHQNVLICAMTHKNMLIFGMTHSHPRVTWLTHTEWQRRADMWRDSSKCDMPHQHTATHCNTLQHTATSLICSVTYPNVTWLIRIHIWHDFHTGDGNNAYWLLNYRSLLQNIVSFMGLFCKRDLWF